MAASQWILFLALLGPGLAAQEPMPTLKLSTRVVAVQAVVVDARGVPVEGLTPADFTLKQDGKEQEIRYFSQDGSLPLTLALLVDTSSSQKAFIEDEIEASEKFFRQMMSLRDDRATLVQFDYDVLRLQPLTPQVEALENSLRKLSMPHPVPPTARGGTLLYDAVVATSKAALSGERGRRAMVLLTDGDDHGSRSSQDEAIAAAQRADIVVYSVLYSALEAGPRLRVIGTDPGKAVLTEISAATGGRVFTVSRDLPLELIFARIEEELRLGYQIGYTPPEGKPGSYHKIELRAKDKRLAVEARRGYFGPR